MIVYPPMFYGAELKLTFKGKLTWKVADTLHTFINILEKGKVQSCFKIYSRSYDNKIAIKYMSHEVCTPVGFLYRFYKLITLLSCQNNATSSAS